MDLFRVLKSYNFLSQLVNKKKQHRAKISNTTVSPRICSWWKSWAEGPSLGIWWVGILEEGPYKIMYH